MRVDAGVRQEPRADAPAQEERADDAKRRDEKRRAADLEHLRDRRLEADLEEQEDRAELRQRLERRVALERFEARESRERQIAEQDAGAQFSEHRWLAHPREEVPADFGCRKDERQREDKGRQGMPCTSVSSEHTVSLGGRARPTAPAVSQPRQQRAFEVDERRQHHEDLDDDRRHLPDPLDRRVVLVHVALDERVGDDRLRAPDVRPAAAERVAGNLRHREELQHPARRGPCRPRDAKSATMLLSRMAERNVLPRNCANATCAWPSVAIPWTTRLCITSKKPALVSSVIDRNSGNRK